MVYTSIVQIAVTNYIDVKQDDLALESDMSKCR